MSSGQTVLTGATRTDGPHQSSGLNAAPAGRRPTSCLRRGRARARARSQLTARLFSNAARRSLSSGLAAARATGASGTG